MSGSSGQPKSFILSFIIIIIIIIIIITVVMDVHA